MGVSRPARPVTTHQSAAVQATPGASPGSSLTWKQPLTRGKALTPGGVAAWSVGGSQATPAFHRALCTFAMLAFLLAA